MVKNKYLILSFLPFLITAYFSEGFLHPDEHYSVLELLQTKISDYTKPEIFNWDVKLQIRPWFQVFFYYILNFLNPFSDPFITAFMIRLLNGALGWFALRSLLRFSFPENYEKKLLIYSLIWFVPFLFVRTSSESLSASFFIFGSVLFLKNRAFLSGLLWGLSFLVRYQMGIVVLVGSLWRLFYKRDFKFFCVNAVGILLLVGLGPLFDYWGYGEWTYSPFNYLYTNLVENRSANFGVSPFWYYLTKPVVKGGGPLGLYFLAAFALYLFRERSSFWSWTTMAFFLVHSLIPHKEVRFLSLIYLLIPFFIFKLRGHVSWISNKKILIPLIVINFLMMGKSSLTPIEGSMKLYRYVYQTEDKVYYTPQDKNGNYFKFTMPFYEGVYTETIPFIEGDTLTGKVQILSTTYDEYKSYKNSGCKKAFASYSDFVLENLNFFNWANRSAVMTVWNCW